VGVYFVYGSFDCGPSGRYARWFPQATVLEWFQHHWDGIAVPDREESDRRLEEVLGCGGWFLWNPFPADACVPQTNEQLIDLVAQCVEQHACQLSPFCLQVFTEDDVWASAHPELAAGLLRFARRWDVLSPDEPLRKEREPPGE
jgi:hypothetical protein